MGEKVKTVLSISMLVSNNRRDTIEKCMESLVPLRKAVPSELVIVDTGCTDGSVEIAGTYADKVVEFTWCRDFSAARNAGLRECTGEWFLYLDDDEWFEDVSELIAFFKGEEKEHCDALWYIQRNYDDFSGKTFVDTYVGRVVKLTPQTRFCGKIHEWLEPLPKMIKQTRVFVHHYGYVYKSEEDKRKHFLRNLTLEEEAVKENPGDIRMCCQLVQEYRAAKRYKDARELLLQTLANTTYDRTNSFVQYLLVTLPKIYREEEAYAAALEELERLEREPELLHQTRLTLFYEKIYIYGKTGQEKELQQACRQYLDEYERKPEAGAPEEFAVMDFAQYTALHQRQKVVKLGIKSILRSEAFVPAEYFFEKADWTGEAAAQLVAALGQCYANTGNGGLLTKYLPRILREKDLEVNGYAMLHTVYENYPEKREALAADLESLGCRSGNLGYFHLLYTESKGITTEQDIREYYEKSDRKYEEEVALLLLKKAEKSVLLASEQKRIGTITAAMKEYIAAAKRYADIAYGAELWEGAKLSDTPGDIGFAHKLENILEEENASVFAEGVKQALKRYPAMLPAVRALLEEREVLGLARQLKAAARMQLAEGRTKEAMAILSELAVMLPEDEEVKELLGKA